MLFGKPFVMARGSYLVSQHSPDSDGNACSMFDPPPRAVALWYALCQLSPEWPLIIMEPQALMSLWVVVYLRACSNSVHNQVNTLQHVVAILIKERCCSLSVCVFLCVCAYISTVFECLGVWLCVFTACVWQINAALLVLTKQRNMKHFPTCNRKEKSTVLIGKMMFCSHKYLLEVVTHTYSHTNAFQLLTCGASLLSSF